MRQDMESIGTITKIPSGTTVKRKSGEVLKVGDTIAVGERLDIANPSPDFTIAWGPKPAPANG
jgi:hypothetical protein